MLLRRRLLGLGDLLDGLLLIGFLDATIAVGYVRLILLHPHITQLVITRLLARSHVSVIVAVAVQVQVRTLLNGLSAHGRTIGVSHNRSLLLTLFTRL